MHQHDLRRGKILRMQPPDAQGFFVCCADLECLFAHGLLPFTNCACVLILFVDICRSYASIRVGVVLVNDVTSGDIFFRGVPNSFHVKWH